MLTFNSIILLIVVHFIYFRTFKTITNSTNENIYLYLLLYIDF